MMKVLNLGSINIDYVYNVKDFPKPGETISSKSYQINCGGKGLNQSVALSKAGSTVFHIGKISKNDNFLLEFLKENNIDTTFIKNDSEVSGHAIINVNDKGENNIVLFSGANSEISENLIDEALKVSEKGDVFLMQNETSNISYGAKKAKEKGLITFLNAAPIDEKLNLLDYKDIDILCVNETEGFELTKEKEPKLIFEYLKKSNPEIKLLITLGEKGSMYFYKDEIICQDIFKTNPVDTTAAGDTYIGYFISSLLKNKNVSECMEIAAKASSITISREGAGKSIPFLEEVKL